MSITKTNDDTTTTNNKKRRIDDVDRNRGSSSNNNNNDDNQLIRGMRRKDLKEYASLCYSMARKYWLDGDNHASLKLYDQSLDLHQRLFGGNENNETIASIYNNIGLVLSSLRDYDRAYANYQKALTIQQNVYFNIYDDNDDDYDDDECLIKHPSIAKTYNNIGLLCFHKGDYNDALINLHKSLRIKKSIFGKNHPSLISAYSNIGSVLNKIKDYDGALMDLKKALTIQELTLGKDHINCATSHNNIGMTFYNKGDYDNALIELQNALQIYTNKYGTNHRLTKQTNKWVNITIQKQLLTHI